MAAGKTVLIVEDDPLSMRLFVDVIEHRGYGVLQAADAIAGIALARERRPDLILMDVGLPCLAGDEAVRSLKADGALRHIPVVILTAFAMRDELERIRRCGCDELRTKPILPSELEELIRRHIAA
jgi:two-component system, cell cycle response regulator DivK